MEIETYYKTIADKESFLSEFQGDKNSFGNFKKAICIYKDFDPYKNLIENSLQENKEGSNVLKLLKYYTIIVFDADELETSGKLIEIII